MRYRRQEWVSVTQPYPVALRTGRVVLWGRSNVGKSTVANSLVGDSVAVVSHRPRMTRHQTAVVWNGDDFQIELIDTPGTLKPQDHLDKFMARSAARSLKGADAALFVVDGSVAPSEADELALHSLMPFEGPIFLVLNKADLSPDRRSRFQEAYLGMHPFEDFIDCSAEIDDNLSDLTRAVVKRLPDNRPFRFSRVSAPRIPRKREVAEVIQERILQHFTQEIPNASTVLVESIQLCPGSLLKIVAAIHVERPTQKKIVIGQGGRMIKRVGTDARKILEQLYGRKVFLRLRVDVTLNWRHRETLVRRLGYQLD